MAGEGMLAAGRTQCTKSDAELRSQSSHGSGARLRIKPGLQDESCSDLVDDFFSLLSSDIGLNQHTGCLRTRESFVEPMNFDVRTFLQTIDKASCTTRGATFCSVEVEGHPDDERADIVFFDRVADVSNRLMMISPRNGFKGGGDHMFDIGEREPDAHGSDVHAEYSTAAHGLGLAAFDILQQFRLVVGRQRIDDILEFAPHHI